MAEREQRTEEATPRKREQLREQGQIARSADVGSAAVVVATCAALAFAGGALVHAVSQFASRSFRLVDASRPLQASGAAVDALVPLAIPLMAATLAAAAAGVAQSRVFSFTLLAWKPERMDPVAQLGHMLDLKQTAIELLKQLAKLGTIGWLVYKLIAGAMPTLEALAASSPNVAASSVAAIAAKLALRVSMAFLVVAAVDYALAYRKFIQDAMMSRDEVRDERKQEDGRPEVRERMRRRMREMGKNRALSDMRKATVVITNPTHYAVALRYVANKDFAPLVLAKGKDDLALAMRARARQHQVPVIENRPLARALYGDGKVGRPIPVDLYRAVAEVIAYVVQLHARSGGHAERRAPGAPSGSDV